MRGLASVLVWCAQTVCTAQSTDVSFPHHEIEIWGDNPMILWVGDAEWSDNRTYCKCTVTADENSSDVEDDVEVEPAKIFPEEEVTINMSYACRRRSPVLFREVRVLNRLTLIGANPHVVRAVLGDTWSDPGSICLNDLGEEVDATVQPQAISLAVEADHTVRYTCPPAFAERTVKIREALRLAGPNPHILLAEHEFGALGTWEDPGALCIQDDGQRLASPAEPSLLPLQAPVLRAVRYACPAVPTQGRLVEVRQPIRFNDELPAVAALQQIVAPPHVSSLWALFRAQDLLPPIVNGSEVVEWRDTSGSSHHLELSAGSVLYRSDVVRQRQPSLEFVQAHLAPQQQDSAGPGSELTVFVVLQPAGSFELLLIGTVDGAGHQLRAYSLNADALDSNEVSLGMPFLLDIASLRVGVGFHGFIHQIAIYNASLTDQAIEQVKHFLLQEPSCSTVALQRCGVHVPCLELREGSSRHFAMWPNNDGTAHVEDAVKALGEASWTCTCAGAPPTCAGLWGTWSCPGFYDEIVTITLDLSDDFTAQIADDSVEVCVTEGGGRFTFHNMHAQSAQPVVTALQDDTNIAVSDVAAVVLQKMEAHALDVGGGQDITADKPVWVSGSCVVLSSLSSSSCEQVPTFVVTSTATVWGQESCPQGYTLASIHSAADDQFLASLLDGSAFYWIGLRVEFGDNGAQWTWKDGSPLDYTKWISSESSVTAATSASRNNYCALVDPSVQETEHGDSTPYAWKSGYCHHTYRSVCRLQTRCSRRACRTGFLLKPDASARFCAGLVCSPAKDSDTCCDEAAIQGGTFGASGMWTAPHATCIEADPLDNYAGFEDSQVVGLPSCPDANSTAEAPLSDRGVLSRDVNTSRECAALCSAMQEECSGFNMNDGGCQLCSSGNLTRGRPGVSAHLKLVTPSPPLLLPPQGLAGFERLTMEYCLGEPSLSFPSLTLWECAQRCIDAGGCSFFARPESLGPSASGECLATFGSLAQGHCNQHLYRRTQTKIMLVNAVDTAAGWEISSLKLFSDSQCVIELPRSGAIGRGFWRSQADSPWELAAESIGDILDDDPITSVELQQNGESGCAALTCAFEVTLPLTFQVGGLKVHQGRSKGSSSVAQSIAVRQQLTSGEWTDLWVCSTVLDGEGDGWGTCSPLGWQCLPGVEFFSPVRCHPHLQGYAQCLSSDGENCERGLNQQDCEVMMAANTRRFSDPVPLACPDGDGVCEALRSCVDPQALCPNGYRYQEGSLPRQGFGGSLGQLPADSAQECALRCDATPGCLSFEWSPRVYTKEPTLHNAGFELGLVGGLEEVAPGWELSSGSSGSIYLHLGDNGSQSLGLGGPGSMARQRVGHHIIGRAYRLHFSMGSVGGEAATLEVSVSGNTLKTASTSGQQDGTSSFVDDNATYTPDESGVMVEFKTQGPGAVLIDNVRVSVVGGPCNLNSKADPSNPRLGAWVFCTKKTLHPLPVVIQPSVVSTLALGSHRIRYSCRDSGGRLSTRTRDVTVRQALQLRGTNPQRVRVAITGTWVDPGAECLDARLSWLSVDVTPLQVALDRPGVHTVVYRCVAVGSEAVEKRREVEVLHPFTLYGDNPMVVLRHDADFDDPGSLCVGRQGQQLPATVMPAHPSTSSLGPLTLTYTCTDMEDGVVRSLSRTVTVTWGAPTCVLRGRASVNALAPGEPFVDPLACCVDPHGQLLPPPHRSVQGAADPGSILDIIYSCPSAHGGAATAKRTVRSNSGPSVRLLGRERELATRGVPYIDAGAVCIDAEDGWIEAWGSSSLGAPQRLPVLRAGAVDIVEGVPENAFDGDDGGVMEVSCQSCVQLRARTSLAGLLTPRVDEEAMRTEYTFLDSGQVLGLQECGDRDHYAVHVDTDVAFTVICDNCTTPSRILYLRLDSNVVEDFDFEGLGDDDHVNLTFDGRWIECSTQSASSDCRGLTIGVPVPVVIISVDLNPRHAGSEPAGPAGDSSPSMYSIAGTFYRASCVVKQVDGPFTGSCGGPPYLHPTTGEYVDPQGENAAQVAFQGNFEECKVVCRRMPRCVKFQVREGLCYFSGTESQVQEAEPSWDPMWTCGLVIAARGSRDSVGGSEGQANWRVEASEECSGPCQPFLWLDLGTARVVHSVRLYGSVQQGSILVGATVPEKGRMPGGNLCAQDVTVTRSLQPSGGVVVACAAPLAGRYVTLLAGGAGDGATALFCEVEVIGTVGPAAPAYLWVEASPAGCSGVTQGLFKLAVASTKLGVRYEATMTTPTEGMSPGSKLGSSHAGSVGACQQQCVADLYCEAIVFSASTQVCDRLNRTYDALFVADGSHVVSNKVTGSLYEGLSGPCENATSVGTNPGALAVSSVDGCKRLCDTEVDCVAAETDGSTCFLRSSCAGQPGSPCSELCAYRKLPRAVPGSTVARELRPGSARGAPGSDAWVLRSSGGSLLAASAGGTNLPHLSAWTVLGFESSPTCVSVSVRPHTVEDSCTWLVGFSSQPGHLQCSDGHECQGDGCCDSHGRVARCPPDRPVMSAVATCGGDHCCVTSSDGQGERACSQSSLSSLGSSSTSSGGSGRGTTTSRIETSNSVDTSTPGLYEVVHTCVDAVGAQASVSRAVEVGCEEPNPSGPYGGNRVDCRTLQAQREGVVDTGDCARSCIAASALECEAYEFLLEEGSCQFLTNCTGKYFSLPQNDRKAAYCRKLDRPPTVVLSPGNLTVLEGEAWVEPPFSCLDVEDDKPPVPVSSVAGTLDTSVPGHKQVLYTCTDSQGQSSSAVRMVTVKSDCSVPAVSNAADNGVCGDGPARRQHGESCIVECAEGYQANYEEVLCSTDVPTAFESTWQPADPACGARPCLVPKVEHAVEDPIQGQLPCLEDNGLGRIPDGGMCTPSCETGYLATERNLSCTAGTFTPLTFQCRLPAEAPASIFCALPGAVSANLTWLPGASNDCEHPTDVVQGRLHGVGDDWQQWQGCESVAARPWCTAVGLQEGETYEFRVKTTCTNQEYESGWTTSEPITLRAVEPPDVLLRLPTGTMKVNPGQVLLAVTAACTVVPDSSTSLSVQRTGDARCPLARFSVSSTNMSGDSASGPGTAGLVNGRIIIATPPLDFFAPGCDYAVVLKEGLLQTLEQPSKSSPEFTWVFQWIDPAPVQLLLEPWLQEPTLAGITVTFRVVYDIQTVFNCTVAPVAAEDPPVLFDGSPPQLMSVGPLSQSADQSPVAFTCHGLVPSKQYAVECAGYKLGKPWIKSTCGSLGCPPANFTTAADSSTEVGQVTIRKVARCQDGRLEELEEPENKTAEQLKLGNVLLVNQYERLCNGDVPLGLGATAWLQLQAGTQPRSAYASFQWLSGPVVDFNFTKQAPGDEKVVLEKKLQFQVCSHASAYLHGYPCTVYTMELTCLDTQLSIAEMRIASAAAPLPADAGDLASSVIVETTHVSLSIGTQVELDMEVDDDFNLTELTVALGSTTDGFTQQYSLSGRTLSFAVEGQGTNLPLIMAWRGVEFFMNYSVSFYAPTLTMERLRVQLLEVQPALTAQLGHVPSTPAVVRTAEAERFLRIAVLKPGVGMHSPGLCIGRPHFQGWSEVQCVLQVAALVALDVQLEVRNYMTGAFELADGTTLHDHVTVLPPVMARIVTEESRGDLVGSVNLDDTKAGELQQEVIIVGYGFPATEDVSTVGAGVPGYQLFMQPESSDADPAAAANEVPLCRRIEVLSSDEIRCGLALCIDAQYLTATPPVVLQLGDLRTDPPVMEQLLLPQPAVDDYGPQTALDAGVSTFWFVGKSFGLPLDQRGACTAADTLQGSPAALASAHLTVGEALCEVDAHNDTHMQCTTRQSKRPLRLEPVLDEEEQGEIVKQQSVQVSMAFGRHRKLKGDAPTVSTSLYECRPGQYRSGQDAMVCRACPRGTFSNPTSAQWPLGCESCPSTAYQSELGQTGCTPCPANTASVPPATSVDSCRCLPGYYSQTLDDYRLSGLAGHACKKCHGEDLTTAAVKAEPCGTVVPISSSGLCDEPRAQLCVPHTGATNGYRLCQTFCPGGTVWPKAKPYFYVSGHVAVAAGGGPDFRPTITQCAPLEACEAGNQCAQGYKGSSCAECASGFYREKLSNLCRECDSGQVIGTVIMVGAAVLLSVGSFFASLAYMKCLTDPVFANRVEALVKRVVAMLKCTSVPILQRLWLRRVRVTVGRKDVSQWWGWVSRKDLGLIFRVEPGTRAVHVAGVRSGSPARRLGVRANWQLLLLNGRAVRADTEEEIVRTIAGLSLPMTMTFQALRFSSSASTGDEDSLGAKDVLEITTTGTRMLMMSLSIMQSFTGVARLDLSWPPVFNDFAAVLQQLLMNFDFFHPECTVEAPYDRKWLLFVSVPYLLIGPLTCSFLIIRCLAFRESRRDPQFRDVQRWLLTNAWSRSVLSIVIVCLQFHLEQLLSPFVCEDLDDGSRVVKAARDIPCERTDSVYFLLSSVASCGFSVVGALFVSLLVCLHKSYHWQVGAQVRDRLPFYVAVLEASTSGMRGYVPVMRERVVSNIVVVKTYPAVQVPPESSPLLGGQTQDDDMLEACHDQLKSRTRFKGALRGPDELEGSFFTYGWVLIVNTFGRQFLLMLAVVGSASFPPFGAAAQSLIFTVNFILIMLVFPYQSALLNCEEALLTGCLAFLTWMGCFRELLLQHKRAQDYPTSTSISASVVDVLVLVIACIIIGTLAYNFLLLFRAFVQRESNASALNRARFRRKIEEERALGAEAEGSAGTPASTGGGRLPLRGALG